VGVRTSASASTTTTTATCAATASFVAAKLGEFCPSRRRSVTVVDAQLRPKRPWATDDTSTATAAHVRWLAIYPLPVPYSLDSLLRHVACALRRGFWGRERGMGATSAARLPCCSSHTLRLSFFFFPSLLSLLRHRICKPRFPSVLVLTSGPTHHSLFTTHLRRWTKKNFIFFLSLSLFTPFSISLFFLLFFRQLFMIPSAIPSDVSSAPFSGCRVAA